MNRNKNRDAAADSVGHGQEGGLLAISLAGAAVLSITDPVGRRMFYNPDSLRYVSEIPSSMADQGSVGDTEYGTASPPSDRIDIPDAVDGDYRIEVMGHGEGLFGISITGYDREGAVTGWSGTGVTRPGSRAVYLVRYSPEPGDPLAVREVAPDSLPRR